MLNAISLLRREGEILDISGLEKLENLTLGIAAHCEDADLACLKNLKRLKSVQINPANFSDAGMAYLAGLTEMERLGIGGRGLTDEGLGQLKNMWKLNYLKIMSGTSESGGRFTDKALRELAGFPALSYLRIDGDCTFSRAAVDRFRERLTNLVSFEVGGDKGKAKVRGSSGKKQGLR